MVRLVRAVVLGVREAPYVEAAIAGGTPTWKILLRHILPNTIAPLIVQATYICASAILIEAALSFLGAGTPPEIPTWGNMIAQSRLFLRARRGRSSRPASRSRWWCSPSICSATACATGSTRASRGGCDAPPRGPRPARRISSPSTASRARSTACRSTCSPARRSASSASPAAARASRRSRSCGCCRRVSRRTVGGSVTFEGRDLVTLDEAAMRQLRGNRLAMIFQEPMTSLNPVLTVGHQIAESVRIHTGASAAAARGARRRDAAAGQDPRRRAARSTTIRISSPAACASA